jgi:hypothetical protein
MNRLHSFPSLFIVVSMAMLLPLAGCAGFGAASFPNASVNRGQVSVGTIQGSNYGGHAPLVASHIYLLEATDSGYGTLATSLLSSSYAGSYPTTQNVSDPNIPTSWYYETTDATGSFNITGDYTCTAGDPVYLYAYGGTPSFPNPSNTFNVSSVSITGSSTPYTVTFTTTTTELAYVGEQVSFSGLPSTDGLSTLNAGTYSVVSTNLTTNTFAVQPSSGITASGSPTVSGSTATLIPAFNPGIVNLAVLGVCPNSGTFSTGGTLFNGATFSPLQFVYINEVSSVAAAYALQGFALSSNNSAAYIGTSPNTSGTTGYSTGNLIGLENAALNAGNLYDIQGGNISTVYAGEGHIARSTTAAGNGNVPQSLIDTLGNIIAACVDSNNTASGNSPQCATLFATATNTGIPCTVGAGNAITCPSGTTAPVDTAQAALNIAWYPAGAAANTSTFMSSLYTLPQGNVPFTPHLSSQPNDFTLAIQYPSSLNSALSAPTSIAIDANGNAWFDTAGNDEISVMNPLGVITYTTPAASVPYGFVTVDSSGNAWSGCKLATCSETVITPRYTSGNPVTPTSAGIATYPVKTGGIYDPYMTVASYIGEQYIAATLTTSQTQWETFAVNASGSLATGWPKLTGIPSSAPVVYGAIDNDGYIWWTADTTSRIMRFNSVNGLVSSGFPLSSSSSRPFSTPEMPATDLNDNLWVPNAGGTYANTLSVIATNGSVTAATGATLSTPYAVAVDGDDNVYVTNSGGSTVAKFNGSTATAISPSANYSLGGQIANPLIIATDPSGDAWITSSSSNTIVQWIGAGAPTYTPFSIAQGVQGIGSRP